ncbi:hypothetical protein Sru01_48550 [Sphaerisporangium rufum]|uniref:Uncharacterized protein n=1 Tax=Sphaerisporangium rufum TaxID=1381558 RepID=A0A919V3B1_9ACTN|nr:hypothetical protein Sru01_48550 [Sphaerisporangium rufum]
MGLVPNPVTSTSDADVAGPATATPVTSIAAAATAPSNMDLSFMGRPSFSTGAKVSREYRSRSGRRQGAAGPAVPGRALTWTMPSRRISRF